MDCEKFDLHVIAALYDELDELTYAALRRHVEGCSRCASVWAGLRATREVGILPLEEPPDDLEARILDAVDRTQQAAPWHKKVLRGLAWAGSHAMRPQLAMAALFFLVIGSSLLLLRARPGTRGPVSIHESGTPAAEPIELAAAPASPPVAAAASVALGPLEAPSAGAAATAAPADGWEKARGAKMAGDVAGADAARDALANARALRDRSGCTAAVATLDAVAVAFPGTQTAADAMWDEATCYGQMGDTAKAQSLYLALRSTGYHDRAEQQLAATESKSNVQNQMAARAVAAAPAAAPPAAAPAGGPPAAAAAAPMPMAAKAAKMANDSENAAGASAGKASPKRPSAGGATNPRAPAAPAPRAADHASAYAP